jgi:hypothetical protein
MLRAPSVSQPSKAEYALAIAVPVHSIWKVENLWERPAERWLNATVTVIPILCGPRLFLICASKKNPPSAGPAGIQRLPKAEQQIEEWQTAVENLINAAEVGGGWFMLARIGVMRALNRHVERVFGPSHKR